MFFHKICGSAVKSNIPIPELLDSEKEETGCIFHLLSADHYRSLHCQWLNTWRFPDGRPWLSFGKNNGDHVLRFHGLSDFAVSGDGRRICAHPEPHTPLNSIKHLLMDQVIPLALSIIHETTVLHASAVKLGDEVIAFFGETGLGKSTLTASFCQQGFALITDDCLLLDQEEGRIVAIPSYPSIRLWPETMKAFPEFGSAESSPVAHYTTKKRIGLESGRIKFCEEPTPLSRLYLLSPVDDASEKTDIDIDPISPRDAFMELVKHSFQLDITDREKVGQAFKAIGEVADVVPVYRLSFPRDLSRLGEVREAVLEHSK